MRKTHDPRPRKTRLPFVVEFSLGSGRRRLEVSAPTLVVAGVVAVAAGLLAPCAAAYLAFRDDMLAELVDRQTQMRYAYEDRLASLRLRLDQATSRQFLDQGDVESKVQTLAARQARLETRAALVRGSSKASPPRTPALSPFPHAARPSRPRDCRQARTPMRRRPRSGRSLSPASTSRNQKASSCGYDATMTAPRRPPSPSAAPPAHRTNRPRQSADARLPLQSRLGHLEDLARSRRAGADPAPRPARRANSRGRRAAAARFRRRRPAGGALSSKGRARAEAFAGGPFVPADRMTGDLLFERELTAAQSAATTLEGLRSALPSVPLRKPLAGAPETTSGFGYRTDPFFGRPALHTGVDLRDDYGSPVRATAGGVVVSAGTSGGYGQMVEIDHGSGLATRYAHLSAISVAVGQEVRGRDGRPPRLDGPLHRAASPLRGAGGRRAGRSDALPARRLDARRGPMIGAMIDARDGVPGWRSGASAIKDREPAASPARKHRTPWPRLPF